MGVFAHTLIIITPELHIIIMQLNALGLQSNTPFTLEPQNRSDRSRTVSGCSVNVTIPTQTVFAWNG